MLPNNKSRLSVIVLWNQAQFDRSVGCDKGVVHLSHLPQALVYTSSIGRGLVSICALSFWYPETSQIGGLVLDPLMCRGNAVAKSLCLLVGHKPLCLLLDERLQMHVGRILEVCCVRPGKNLIRN